MNGSPMIQGSVRFRSVCVTGGIASMKITRNEMVAIHPSRVRGIKWDRRVG